MHHFGPTLLRWILVLSSSSAGRVSIAALLANQQARGGQEGVFRMLACRASGVQRSKAAEGTNVLVRPCPGPGLSRPKKVHRLNA